MPEQDSVFQLPSMNDHDAWLAYWSGQDQPWRTEPEIERRRQEELSKLRATIANIEQGVYPFKGEKLSRADIAWLLAHPLEDAEASKDSEQLDLCGADLKRAWTVPEESPSGGVSNGGTCESSVDGYAPKPGTQR